MDISLPNTISSCQAIDALEAELRKLGYCWQRIIPIILAHVRRNGTLEGLVSIGYLDGQDEARLEQVFADAFREVPYDSPRWDDDCLWWTGPESVTAA